MSFDQPDHAVVAIDLGKNYHIFARPEDRLKDLILGKWRKYHRDFWALRHVDLAIPHGTTLGILGRNGSGKSTLLQMICGTLQPSEGQLTTHGRIAALLELGAGFDPNFTGRENVIMNATILGLDRATIEERYDSIVEFADIGEFVEAPVKTYSSGMFARLAFAVAINVDPDILVVDEALSVGDEAFQRKCFNRIEQIRKAGATVLFVTHSVGTVVDLCDSALLLDQGEVLMNDTPKKVVAEYQKLIYAPPHRFNALRGALKAKMSGEIPAESEPLPTAVDSDPEPAESESTETSFDPGIVSRSRVDHTRNGAHIIEGRVVDEDGNRANILRPDRIYRFQIRVAFDRPAYNVRFGMHIKTVSGFGLGGMVSEPHGKGVAFIEAGATIWASFAFRPLLTANTYFFDASVHAYGPDGGEELLHMVADLDIFRINAVAQEVAAGYIRFSTEDYFDHWIDETCNGTADAPTGFDASAG